MAVLQKVGCRKHLQYAVMAHSSGSEASPVEAGVTCPTMVGEQARPGNGNGIVS